MYGCTNSSAPRSSEFLSKREASEQDPNQSTTTLACMHACMQASLLIDWDLARSLRAWRGTRSIVVQKNSYIRTSVLNRPSIHQSIQPGQQGTEATNLPKGRVADKERDSIRRDPTRSDPIRLVLFYFISFRFVVVSFRDASACEQVSESVETIPVAINR
mmetsp:Transcript_3194/g.7692  ORF Transcript_3194/g.7692 Transcript_3194/m.7692 type:complete len:160 (+) Transcript_3194:929-1408(+)